MFSLYFQLFEGLSFVFVKWLGVWVFNTDSDTDNMRKGLEPFSSK